MPVEQYHYMGNMKFKSLFKHCQDKYWAKQKYDLGDL